MQSFTACMPLLMAGSTFRLGRRCWNFLNSVVYTISVPYLSNLLLLLLLLLHPFNSFFFRTIWVSRYHRKVKPSLDLNEACSDGVLEWRMQIICTSLRTDNQTEISSLNFYMLDALPDAQLTMPMH